MTINATLIAPAQQTVTQWAGGETRQLAIAPVGATVAARDFHWRFSTATVLQSGPFTVFDGYSRYLAIRSGAGLDLADDLVALEVHPRVECRRKRQFGNLPVHFVGFGAG